MTEAQVTAELKRKASLGIQPTNKANKSEYDKIASSNKSKTSNTNTSSGTTSTTTTKPKYSYLDAYGGRNSYISGQQARYAKAKQLGDLDLINRLQSDAEKNNYSLTPVKELSWLKRDQFTPPKTETLSWDEALKKATATFNPLYQQARTNAGEVAQQQQNLLRQQMNSRGQLSSGGTEKGSADISSGLLKALSGLDSNYYNQLASYAQSLVDKSESDNRQSLNDAFNRYAAEQGLDFQNAQYNRQLERDTEGDSQWLMSYAYNLLPYFMPTWGEQDTSNINWTQAMGQVPESLGNTSNTLLTDNQNQYLKNKLAEAKKAGNKGLEKWVMSQGYKP